MALLGSECSSHSDCGGSLITVECHEGACSCAVLWGYQGPDCREPTQVAALGRIVVIPHLILGLLCVLASIRSFKKYTVRKFRSKCSSRAVRRKTRSRPIRSRSREGRKQHLQLNSRDVLVMLMIFQSVAFTVVMFETLSVLTFDPAGLRASRTIPSFSALGVSLMLASMFELGFAWLSTAAKQKIQNGSFLVKKRKLFQHGANFLIIMFAFSTVILRAARGKKQNVELDSPQLLSYMALSFAFVCLHFFSGRYLARVLGQNESASTRSLAEAQAINQARFLVLTFYVVFLFGQMLTAKVNYVSGTLAWMARVPVMSGFLGIQLTILCYLNKHRCRISIFVLTAKNLKKMRYHAGRTSSSNSVAAISGLTCQAKKIQHAQRMPNSIAPVDSSPKHVEKKDEML